MPVFFNGQLLISPTVASKVDDSAMANRNLTVPNILAVIGASTGGKPNTALRFGSPAEARDALRSGYLLDAIEKAFAPSAQTGAAQYVVGVRVNPAVQSSLTLLASATPVIVLTSTDYGLWTNQIKTKIESATTKGKRLTTQVGDSYFTADNVYRDAFSVVYTGAQASATITTTNSTVTLSAPAGSVVASIPLADYPTVRQLVDRINAVSGFSATVLEGNGEKPALNGLDTVTTQSCKTTPYTVTANLQAVVDWFNGYGEGFITATRQAGVGTVPDNLAWTYLAGGSDGVTTSTEWSNALATLQNEDVQWIVPLSSDASIHAMADAHCIYMTNVGRMERRAFVGGAAGQTIQQVKDAAKLINSDRTAQVYPGHYEYNASGTLELRPPFMTAAMVAAGFAGLNPGETLTNKALTARGVETKTRNPTDTDGLIQAGVLVLNDTRTGYRVVKAVTTWLTNLNYNRVEVSTGFACDYTARNVRNAVEGFVGEPGSPRTLNLIKDAVVSALRELARPAPAGPGVLVGDAESPAFKNVTVSLEGDVVRVEFQASPVIPVNYILITVHAVPYSGVVTAA